ncbi:unnamed protein product [Mytilus coruscus]|uniref:Uncharacterized protein n=1 Tax=Mytilus coruscus TaxID=42192 RepID=A0A6J8C7E4_MYTCO|nr:unnamed protein product [Mytilus coruscus]
MCRSENKTYQWSLKPTEYVGPVNNFLHSMFSQIDVTLQNKLVTSTTTHYPYKAMIQTLLSYGSEAKKSQLTSQLWKKDQPGHFDDSDVENGGNSSFFDRAQYFNQSQVCDLEAFTESGSSSGSYTLNPFNFQHFNLSQITLKLNQVPVGGNIMQLNYGATSRTILPAFNSMFEVTNKWMRDTGNQLSRNDIAGGNALYCFEIEPNFSDEGQYLNLVKQGTCSLEVNFNTSLPKASTCVVYAEMNTYQLQCVIVSDVDLQRSVLGVFSTDELSQVRLLPGMGVIANTDVSGLPGRHWVAFSCNRKNSLEVFDSFVYSEKELTVYFNKFMRNYSCIQSNEKRLQGDDTVILHNLYCKGKAMRTASLNCHYFVLFRNYRDQLQIQTIGKQIFPGQSKYFLDAYKKATSVAYRPLIIYLNPHTDKTYQLTTDRGVGQTPIVYHSTE